MIPGRRQSHHIKFTGQYPPDWPTISRRIKQATGWRCERCQVHHTPGHVLTVHHLDNDKNNCQDWNLAALCQQCHLAIQGRVHLEQDYIFEHTPWMKPHVKGMKAAIARGEWPSK